MKYLKLLISLLIFNSTPTVASFVDHGLYTTDTVSGLDWLDLTETKNQSVLTVTSQLLSGGIYEGWRYATGDEFNTLIFNYTGNSTNGFNYTEQAAHRIDGLINLLGATATSGIRVFDNGALVFGLLKEFITETNCGGFVCNIEQKNWVGSIVHYDLDSITIPSITPGDPDRIITLIDNSTAHDFLFNYEDTRNDIGSFLIRDSSPVPLPSAVWLLVTGLITMLSFSRRRA